MLEDDTGVLLMKYPDDNPKTVHGVSKPGISNVPPVGMLEVGRVMAVGAAKYGPMNWRHADVSSSIYYDAAMRHLFQWWDGLEADEETGISHLAHAAACLLILLDAKAGGKLKDNRPAYGTAAYHIKAHTKLDRDP